MKLYCADLHWSHGLGHLDTELANVDFLLPDFDDVAADLNLAHFKCLGCVLFTDKCNLCRAFAFGGTIVLFYLHGNPLNMAKLAS